MIKDEASLNHIYIYSNAATCIIYIYIKDEASLNHIYILVMLLHVYIYIYQR